MFAILRKYTSAFMHQNEDIRLLELFKPVYYIVSIFGLFPHAIDFLYRKKHLSVVFKSATYTLACTFLVPIVISTCFALHVLELDAASGGKAYQEDQILTTTNYIIEMILQLLVCTITYICAFKNRNLYVKVLNEMTGCWLKLPESIENKILRRLQTKIYCVILVSFFLLPVLNCPFIYTARVTVWKKILEVLTFDLPELIQFALIVFYIVMIMMVVALLENIEEHVKILYRSKSSRSLSSFGGEPEPLPASLRQLRGVYARALTLKRQINAAFQAPLMLILAQSFHTLISEAHDLYHELRFTNDFVLECCLWIFYQIIKIYALGHSGAILKQQAAEIGRTLHNIPADIDEDISLYLEVQHFTTLMKFQAAEITIFGYFSLESSIIFKVIASASMYLVILVQFDM